MSKVLVRRVILVVLAIGAAMLALGVVVRFAGASAAPAPTGPTVTYTLQGRVYQGDTATEPPISEPLEGVVMSLYCSNNHGEQGVFLRSTSTDAQGWYGLEVYDTDVCEFFNIVETDPDGYFSAGATTVDGNVID
ncbi:MAG: hypothetical protein D6759_15420, partial [Chloroflexi bacterium]